MSCIAPRAHALVNITYIFNTQFKCSRLQMVWSGVYYKTAPFPLLPLIIGATNHSHPFGVPLQRGGCALHCQQYMYHNYTRLLESLIQGGSNAVTCLHSGITFRETNTRANQTAHALSKLGVTRSQRVAILMRNKPELLLTFYGKYRLLTFYSKYRLLTFYGKYRLLTFYGKYGLLPTSGFIRQTLGMVQPVRLLGTICSITSNCSGQCEKYMLS